MKKRSLALAFALALSVPGIGRADQVSDLKAQVDALQRQIDALKATIDQVTTQVQTQKAEQEKKIEQVTTASAPRSASRRPSRSLRLRQSCTRGTVPQSRR